MNYNISRDSYLKTHGEWRTSHKPLIEVSPDPSSDDCYILSIKPGWVKELTGKFAQISHQDYIDLANDILHWRYGPSYTFSNESSFTHQYDDCHYSHRITLFRNKPQEISFDGLSLNDILQMTNDIIDALPIINSIEEAIA